MSVEPKRFMILRTTQFSVRWSKCENYTYWLYLLAFGFFGIAINVKRDKRDINKLRLTEQRKCLVKCEKLKLEIAESEILNLHNN